MIKLTSEQVIQLDKNLSAAMEDLNTAAFESSDQTPLICTGAHIGLALQKLNDMRAFLLDQTVKAEATKRKSVFGNLNKSARPPYDTPQIEVPDPWRMSYDP